MARVYEDDEREVWYTFGKSGNTKISYSPEMDLPAGDYIVYIFAAQSLSRTDTYWEYTVQMQQNEFFQQ